MIPSATANVEMTLSQFAMCSFVRCTRDSGGGSQRSASYRAKRGCLDEDLLDDGVVPLNRTFDAVDGTSDAGGVERGIQLDLQVDQDRVRPEMHGQRCARAHNCIIALNDCAQRFAQRGRCALADQELTAHVRENDRDRSEKK